MSKLRRLVPSSVRNLVMQGLSQLDLRFVELGARSGLMASLYYLLFSPGFRREQRAVLAGRLRYKDSLTRNGGASSLLRRNTHRLEKGLIMRPRRTVFAQDYILDTVRKFTIALRAQALSEEEERWISDVLSSYFEAVEDTEVIAEARKAFSEAMVIQPEVIKTSIPYAHSELPQSVVAFDNLQELFRRRRSVRWFQERPVPFSELQKAVSAATLAPSACNRQPFRFMIAGEKDRAIEVAKCAAGTIGFVDNIPCLIAVVGSLDAFPSDSDRHLIYIDGALAAMQLMLALETLGLSSCPLNFPDVELRERKLEQLLDTKVHERTIMLIAVGYADPTGRIPYSQKKGPEQLIKVI